MRFLMFVASDSQPDAIPEGRGDVEAWVRNTGAKRITGDRLRPAGQAKTVRVRAGKTLVTDGPFAEANETILGFDILECASLEEAIEIAAKHPMARAGRLEVREFWPIEG